MEEGENSQTPKAVWKVALGRPFFILIVIIVTSWLVYDVNVNTLEHARNFTRTLHYHVLRHQTIGVYWFGQQMLNYPIHQFYLLTTFQDFLKNMHTQFGDLQSLSYCLVDQEKLNSTKQQIIVQRRGGTVESYDWYLQKGPQSGKPFSFDDITQIKNTFIDSHSVQIKFHPIDLGNGNIWNINFLIEPFSDTSIIVTFLLNQDVNLTKKHILHFILGCIFSFYLAFEYITKRSSFADNFLNYFLAMFLVLTSILAFSDRYRFQFIFILDGITCLSAWLCALKFYTKGEDYKLSFLLKQSYGMIGRLFASFGPLLIAFSIFAYCVFSRYSGQFSSFWRTFTSLFYICYYNMTYESAIVTGRSNPISMIFFITFVLLFTICIYSSMLVSVFCSYVWGKREEQIKKDIVANLKIQCSSCDHKYKYSERSKIKPKKSFNLSQFLEVNWSNPDECAKYKRVMKARISRLRERAEDCIQSNEDLLHLVTHKTPIAQSLIEEFWKQLRSIQKIVEEDTS